MSEACDRLVLIREELRAMLEYTLDYTGEPQLDARAESARAWLRRNRKRLTRELRSLDRETRHRALPVLERKLFEDPYAAPECIDRERVLQQLSIVEDWQKGRRPIF